MIEEKKFDLDLSVDAIKAIKDEKELEANGYIRNEADSLIWDECFNETVSFVDKDGNTKKRRVKIKSAIYKYFKRVYGIVIEVNNKSDKQKTHEAIMAKYKGVK